MRRPAYPATAVIENSPSARASSDGVSSRDRLPRLFLVLAGFLAIAHAFVVPPFEVADEYRHFWRAYGVSDLQFVAPALTRIPESFLTLHERFPPTLRQAPPKRTPLELAAWLRQPLQTDSTAPVANPAANLYSLVPYVPAALVLRLGRLLDVSPLGQIYAGRLANAAFYIATVYFALSILPGFRLLLLLIALTPMSVNLAASFSADSATMALTALLIAAVFKVAFDPGVISVRRRDWIIVPLLFALVTLCKFNAWLSMLALLIPPRKFGSRKKTAVFGVLCLSVCCTAGFGWQALNHEAISEYAAVRASQGVVLADNVGFLLAHPLRFLVIVQTTSFSMIWLWLWEFVGVFGWLTVPLPGPLFPVYIALLLLAVCTESRVVLTASQRGILACSVMLTIISIHALLWVFQSDAAVLRDAFARSVSVEGMQGRYFLPIGLPALAVMANGRIRPGRLFMALVSGSAAIINILALVTIWNAYYWI